MPIFVLFAIDIRPFWRRFWPIGERERNMPKNAGYQWGKGPKWASEKMPIFRDPRAIIFSDSELVKIFDRDKWSPKIGIFSRSTIMQSAGAVAEHG